MKRWIAVLLLTASVTALAQTSGYIWDYTGFGPDFASNYGWISNGDNTFGSAGGGSFIWPTTISGSNGNDYEVNTSLLPITGGGTYMHFLRAASTSVLPGSGSYISVELTVPSGWQSGGAVPLAIKQCVSGSLTQLGGTTIAVHTGDTLRSIVWGTNLWVFLNNIQQGVYTIPATTGHPGYGGYSIPSGSGFSHPYYPAAGAIKVGHHDTGAPQTVVSTSVATSLLPYSASLKWQGAADDAAGIGVYEYQVSRNGTAMATVPGAEFADATVQPSTAYTYLIQAVDFHGNTGAATSVTLTTPPAGAIDPRRVGLYSTGSYWGGGGEQIDTLSGNLHFTIPLATAQGRTGWTVQANLVYDSQNWRQDNGVNWKLGSDVGYGFGWRALIGSVTPYYTSYYGGADHYVYTDATGAEYRLDHNSGGMWSSITQSVYVWLDTNVSPNRIHFSDGKFWVLGSTSGGTEADAGTMYPTIIEDTWGNQVIVTYDTGAGLPFSTSNPYPYWLMTPNTSSRIVGIEDARADACGYIVQLQVCANPGGNVIRTTFGFTYDRTNYATPHLISYLNLIGNGGSGTGFTYATGAQEPPFGSDPAFSGATTTFLSQAVTGPGSPWQFGYDSAGAGELTSTIFPFGGKIAWNYSSFAYTGGRSLREVSTRYVAPDSAHATNPMWSYGISRPDAQNSVNMHTAMTLTDASGVGAKIWKFNTSGSAWQLGLVSEFIQGTSAGGTALQDDIYTWSQDPAGHPYISAKSTASGQGTSNPVTAYSAQALDQYGNVTQSAVYPYNNPTTPIKIFNNTYLNDATHTASWVFNLLSSATLTYGGTTTTLLTNSYDYCSGGTCPFVVQPYPPPSTPLLEYDIASPVPAGARGGLYSSITNSKSIQVVHYPWGTIAGASGSDGMTTTASADSSTNYAAPATIISQSYNENVGYTAWLGVAQTTGANGEQLTMTYDAWGRPSTGTSAYGAITNFTYATTAPYWQKQTGPNGVTTTTLDGFGRAVRVAAGDSTGDKSETDTVYAPCACSPLGKLQKASQPYAAGGTASAWTAYAYDGLGRTLSVQQPDGASTTNYIYAGNQTKVTDPAGKWKQFTSDAVGNLTSVTEPDPANQPNGTLTTSYTYDWTGHVIQVSMPRGSTTQTRTFGYDAAGRLVTATNPENGTVTYTYNTDNTLQYKHDAKGQDTGYTYDSLKRITQIQRYPNGRFYNPDPCQTVTYTYDTNPVNPSFSQYTYGRLTTAQYGCPVAQLFNGSWYGQTYPATYIDMYSYHRAGGVTAKQVLYYGNYTDASGYQQTASGHLEADYTFDTSGRIATLVNPANPLQYLTGYDWAGNPTTSPCTLTYGYDSMGRPSSVANTPSAAYPCGASWTSAAYDYAGRMTTMQNLQPSVYLGSASGTLYVSESRTYNVNGQLNSMNGMQYNYATGQNNGQISQVIDGLSGETIAYQYDALKRLTTAASMPTSGSSPTAWTQTFQYDGFSNLTAKVLNGSSQPIAVNAGTNQLTNAYYDGNGNMTSGAGATLSYDVANRLATVTAVSGGLETFQYAPDNKRVMRTLPNGTQEFTFYGGQGEKLGVFWLGPPVSGYTTTYTFQPRGMTLWFGWRVVEDFSPSAYYWTNQTGPITQDRLGTNRTGGARYRPYGEEITSTANDQVKFATYTRDSYTGLDYADQRFYASSYGRFNTPDPYQASGGPSDPGSWNRYSYTQGDPVNRVDPSGLYYCGLGFADDGDSDYDLGSVNCGGGGPYGGLPQYLDGCTPYIFAFGAEANSYGASLPNCQNVGGYIVPVAAPAAPPVPSCTLTVDYRGVDLLGGRSPFGAAHGYLSETLTAAPSTTLVYEGQDVNGTLVGYGGRWGFGSLDSDNPLNDNRAGSISGPQVCGWNTILQADINNVNNSQIGYGMWGPNSNSLLRYLLQSLPDSSWYNLPSLIGYYTPLPGLTGRPGSPTRPIVPRRGRTPMEP